jgi:3-hydroxyisobutyrate dehydrogenase
MRERIGVIGLGNIGSRVTRVLLEEYSVTVFDIDEDRRANLADAGATAVDSGCSVGETTDVIICSLPDDEALRTAVLGDDGILAGCSNGEIIVDTSTVSPTVSQSVGDACHEQSVDFLDAPVSGGARNAETGSLTVLVGGDETVLDRVRPVLETIGETVIHVGDTGTGVALKVINNYLFGMNQLVLCEGLSMARAAGIDDETFTETVALSSGHSYALERNMERFVIPDEYDSEFTLSLMRKDLELGENVADEHDVPLFTGGGSDIYHLGQTFQEPSLDSSAIVKLYERFTETD